MIRDCGECREKGLQGVYNCTEDTPEGTFTFTDLDGNDYTRCPRQYITPATMDVLIEYRFYRAGAMPEVGGLYAQPAKWMTQMAILEAAFTEAEEARDGRP